MKRKTKLFIIAILPLMFLGFVTGMLIMPILAGWEMAKNIIANIIR